MSNLVEQGRVWSHLPGNRWLCQRRVLERVADVGKTTGVFGVEAADNLVHPGVSRSGRESRSVEPRLLAALSSAQRFPGFRTRSENRVNLSLTD